jgi:hypothetical protein
MKPININYAYNGFLYEPLFLANDLGLFPKNMQLVFRDGDIPTIRSLSRKTEPGENWFAICDPFAKDISKVQASIGNDSIYIVGSFIDRLPVWIYCNNPDFDPVGNEEGIKLHKLNIDEIRCYKKYNTGYLIGERLRERFLEMALGKLKECDFNQEFTPPINDKTLIVTSDILRVVSEIDNGNIIFNYPQKCEELNPFLFTGILTLKSVIDNHLYSVLAVLAGLRTAIDLLSANSIPPEYLELITNRYSSTLTTLTPDEQKERVSMSLHTLFQEEQIYPKNFDLNEAETGYKIARREWTNLLTKHHQSVDFPDIERVTDPIPALLIKKNWKSDLGLVSVFSKTLGLSPIPPNFSFRNLISIRIIILLATVILFLVQLYYVVLYYPQNFSMMPPNNFRVSILFIFIIQIIITIIVAIDAWFPHIWLEHKKDRLISCFAVIIFLVPAQWAFIGLYMEASKP